MRCFGRLGTIYSLLGFAFVVGWLVGYKYGSSNVYLELKESKMVNGNLDQVEINFAVCEYDNGKRAKCYGFYPNYHPAQEMQKSSTYLLEIFTCPVCKQNIRREKGEKRR